MVEFEVSRRLKDHFVLCNNDVCLNILGQDLPEIRGVIEDIVTSKPKDMNFKTTSGWYELVQRGEVTVFRTQNDWGVWHDGPQFSIPELRVSLDKMDNTLLKQKYVKNILDELSGLR